MLVCSCVDISECIDARRNRFSQKRYKYFLMSYTHYNTPGIQFIPLSSRWLCWLLGTSVREIGLYAWHASRSEQKQSLAACGKRAVTTSAHHPTFTCLITSLTADGS